ncbi:bifunctional Translationally controlled tumor protein (TCTP) domain/Translationally controlled tumor protein/Mss4-like superfamily/Mss4-translationally controlled tumor-associated TCTP [Babesia duncani]|uniref:Bifunctional Translationally controlled tumor protein (TCTP) domain/Translationally controlled tumor protein/Mss4-like superfamily/Mss4-translationally controlled tumor-associated TCTP n=1 Tax=Babesia duncani TaxID=323732 RepID=A0AAD9PLV4_9APIC|nr:bifunctional Translationally controlled tumor protein (TCTP) domain/Translationally controlled tumor protein/Mss4-like superfamily/Mss4-translationally controlled tumor-associated TCTP [Babesia duncani]
MLVYKDLYSGDELCSDAYEQLPPFENAELSGVAFEVKSSKVAKGNEDYGIACNDEDGEGEGAVDAGVEMVIDIVEAFRLSSTSMTKAEYTAYIKKYMKRVATSLSSSNPDRVDKFKEDIQKFVKHVLSNFDDFEFYLGESFDLEAGLVYAYYKGEEISPRLIYLKDGLVEERY